MAGKRAPRDLALSQYFEAVKLPLLLQKATAALAIARPEDPAEFLAQHFAARDELQSVVYMEDSKRGVLAAACLGELAGLTQGIKLAQASTGTLFRSPRPPPLDVGDKSFPPSVRTQTRAQTPPAKVEPLKAPVKAVSLPPKEAFVKDSTPLSARLLPRNQTEGWILDYDTLRGAGQKGQTPEKEEEDEVPPLKHPVPRPPEPARTGTHPQLPEWGSGNCRRTPSPQNIVPVATPVESLGARPVFRQASAGGRDHHLSNDSLENKRLCMSVKTPRAQELLGQAPPMMGLDSSPMSPEADLNGTCQSAGPALALPETGEDLELHFEEIKRYHDTLRRLDEIRCMRDTVLNPAGNLWWDGKRACPGRMWLDHMPEHLKALVGRPFTPEEIALVEADCRLHTAPSIKHVKPKVLYIVGPAGAGKSSIRPACEKLLDISLDDYVEIDGDDIRNRHMGWQQVLADMHVGYRDSMSVLSKPVEALKKNIVNEAIRLRKNLVISQTGQNTEKFAKEAQKMHMAHDYIIDMVGLVVSMHEAGCRAINRSHENGRWHEPSWSKWNQIMKSIQYLMSERRCDNCIIFDNENFEDPRLIYTRTHNDSYVNGVIDRYRSQQREVAHQGSSTVFSPRAGAMGSSQASSPSPQLSKKRLPVPDELGMSR
eukprot:Hpha_TRINITY_DN12710_c0_g1::TRINITY_DN12710_c0_g1_i1::g.114115::m.114115